MKWRFVSILAIAIVILAFSGCRKVIRETPGVRAGSMAASPQVTPTTPVFPEVRELLDQGVLGKDENGYYTVRVEAGETWYHDWIGVFHTVIGQNCFSEVAEAEGEAAFWVAVSQIPEDTHPDKFSGVLRLPQSCEEAREWVKKVGDALDSNQVQKWDGWIDTLSKTLKSHPEYDHRREG